MKHRIYLLNVILLCVLLPGCGGKKELNRLSIVMAAAIDQAPKDCIDFSVQIANPTAMASSDSGSGGAKEAFLNITGSGRTLGEAERDLYVHLPRSVYWSNMQAIIISEEFARNKMDSILDYLDRPNVFRRDIHLVVTSGKAKDVLYIKHLSEKMSGLAISHIQNIAFRHSKSIYPSDIHDFLTDLSDDGHEPLLARLQVLQSPESKGEQDKTNGSEKQEIIKLSGSAVFKNNKMVGWLNDNETRGVLWVLEKAQQGMVTIKYPDPKAKNKFITILNKKAGSKIIIKNRKGIPQVKVVIHSEGRISGQNFTSNSVATNTKMISKLDSEYSASIKREVEIALAKAQKEYDTDVFGIGNAIWRWHPKLWKQLKPKWDDSFRKLIVKVEADAHIRRVGLTMSPTKPQ